MESAASQAADEDPSNISAGTVTSPSVVSISNANVADAANSESNGAGLVPGYFPGLRIVSGRTIDPEDVKGVIRLLEQAGIPACVVGVYALRYFGAGRISNVSQYLCWISQKHTK